MKLKDLLVESIDANKAKELANRYAMIKDEMSTMTGRAMDSQAYDDLAASASSLEVELSKAGYSMKGELLKSGEKSALNVRVEKERAYNDAENKKEADEELTLATHKIKGSLLVMIADSIAEARYAGNHNAVDLGKVKLPKVISYPYQGDVLKNNVSDMVEIIEDQILDKIILTRKFKNRMKPTAYQNLYSAIKVLERADDVIRKEYISDVEFKAAQSLVNKI